MIVPNWQTILEFVAAQRETPVESLKAEIRRLRDAGELGPLPESCSFRIFHDGRSGLELIWFNGDQSNDSFGTPDRAGSTIDRMNVRCRFSAPDWFETQMRQSLDLVDITPDTVRFANRNNIQGAVVGAIPVTALRHLLVEISGRRQGAESYAFKTFPPKLQELFDKWGVTYDISGPDAPKLSEDEFADEPHNAWAREWGITWYRTLIDVHRFSCPAYSVRLKLEPFRPSNYREHAIWWGVERRDVNRGA
jgi:hypothetical protein